jgi:hypothetical protein
MFDEKTHADKPVWIVMAAVMATKSNGSAFDANATGLTRREAELEAARRNAAERDAGHPGIYWFVSMDPLEAMELAGFDVDKLRGRG